MKPVIGILGGMGPRATIQFEQMLLDRLSGSDQALPTIVTINDGSIPDRSDFIMGRGVDPLPRMQRDLRLLESMGADIICVPCNTACAPIIFDRLQTRTSQVINLPEEVVAAIKEQGLQTILLLATDGTIATGTYQNLCAQNGIDCLVPDALTQRLVMAVIKAVKRGTMPEAQTLSHRLRAIIAARGCEAIVLGCTELPLVQQHIVPPECRAVDTLAILADACVGYTKRNTLKGERYDTGQIYA